GQLVLELRLQLELLGVVAFLVAAGGDERPECAALVAVDPIDRMLAAVEAEGGCEQLRAEAASLELAADDVDARDDILQVGVADDQPLEAEAVRAPLDLRAGLLRRRVQELPHVRVGLGELARRERLVDDRPRAAELQAGVRLERDRGGRKREEPLLGRRLELLPAEEDVS